MATGKITKRAVDSMVSNGTKQFLWDGDLKGFGLQVTPTGAKSYVYQYRMGGREAAKKRYTIGRHGSPWTPATARTECERLAIMVRQGLDPADTDRERRRVAVDLAFNAYIPTFVDGYLKPRWKKSWEGGERVLMKEAAPILRNKPLPTITRADIVPVFDRLRSRPAVARLAFATLRKLFKWAEGRGEIQKGHSPIDSEFPAPPAVPARDRVLKDEELLIVWQAAGGLGYPFGPMFELLLVTGQRREEAAGLDWSELHRTDRVWTLPAERAKNGVEHLIALNDLAIAVIDRIAGDGADPESPVKWPRSGFVFTTTGKTAVSGYSRAKARLDKAVQAILANQAIEPGAAPLVVPKWRLHDIRRTVATGLQRLGVRFEVTEAVLNHVSGSKSGVAGIYQRHDWKDEKRAALDAWGRHIQQLHLGSPSTNVVTMARSAT